MGVARRGGIGRLTVGVAIVAALAAGATACGESGPGADPDSTSATTDVALVREPPSAPVSGGTLRFGLGAETNSGWDPMSSTWSSSGTIVSRAVFDRLTIIDEDEEAQPFLAESLTPNDDFTRWDIRLRSGIAFHNGEVLDADALKLNLDRLPQSVLLVDYQAIADVEVLDPLAVRVQLSKPWSTLPYSLSSQAGVIVAPEQIRSATPSADPIGTGPFVFESWERDRVLTVNRNPDYWRSDTNGVQLPYLDRIEFSVLADPTSRTATMDQGGVDVVESFDPTMISHFAGEAEQGKVQMYSNAFDEAAVQFVGFNTTTAPFDDLLARRLVVAAWDKEQTAESVYLGLFPPAEGLFGPNSAYRAGEPAPGFDPELARSLSAEYQAVYGHPLRFTLNLPSTAEFRAVGELAQEQVRAFGIEMEINLLKEADLISNALLGTYEASGLVTFGEPWIDSIWIASNTVAPVGQLALNFSRYADPEIQQALDTIRTTTDRGEQVEQWGIIQNRVNANQNVTFVLRNRSAIIYANDVFGFQTTLPTGQLSRRTTAPYLTETWMAG